VQAAEGEWIPSTDEGNREGWIIMGQILKFDPSKERPPLPSTSYVYIAAQPLEDIPEECFTIPAEWLETPVETGP
jgi:hypothetical protein